MARTERRRQARVASSMVEVAVRSKTLRYPAVAETGPELVIQTATVNSHLRKWPRSTEVGVETCDDGNAVHTATPARQTS